MILGVLPNRVQKLVKAGRLFGWQKDPGKKGSRLWLSWNQVNRYAGSWDRTRRRAWWDKKAIPGVDKQAVEPGLLSEHDLFMETYRLKPDGAKNLERHHGDYFSARQAARELGVKPTTVHQMRMNGTLMGYRRRRPNTLNKTGRRLWWFFLKEDVWALKEDPQYSERSRRAKETYRNRTAPIPGEPDS